MQRSRFTPTLLSAALVTIALSLCATPIGADTYPKQPGVDAQHYVFRLTLLTSDSNEITGNVDVTLRLVRDGVREVFLDLTTAVVSGKGMTVSSVTSAGGPVAFTHVNNRLRLPVPSSARAGQDVTFSISYKGVPGNGLRLLNNIHGERTAFSENWYNQARQWLPMIDHPADKATGEFIVTTKADYQVIGNGALVEQLDLPGGQRRTHWKQSVPISSWLYSLGIARFVVRQGGVVRGVPLSYWAFPQDTEKGLAALERDARGSFEYFSDHVGPYAYEKLAHVEAAGMGGGTEHASNIFYGEKSITAGNAPVVHETAHQWFGDAVTENDWNDVWLSEGFATYFTLLYTEHASGRDAFAEGLRRSRATVVRLEKSLPNTPVVHVNLDEPSVSPNNGLVYQKGGWTLHMLRELVGTEDFWRGIRLYYQRHMNGLASTDDLRRAMEQVSGQDLSGFFRQWLNRSGIPSIDGTWRYDAATKHVMVTVRQTQSAEPFWFPISIGLVQGGVAVPRIHRAQVTDRQTTISIPADAEPESLVFDPTVALLAEFGVLSRSGGR
ncbi:MAG: M1 family metallopeptidase [Vicinamibacterales bacterium]